MINSVQIDTRDLDVTPFFVHLELENIPKSEAAGHLVKELGEFVEVRIAGTRNYSPFFPVEAVWKREGGREITYAERWEDQYYEWKNGETQRARGTSLDVLHSYGLNGSDTSYCRAMKIYSVEQLHNLSHDGTKALGMRANKLKESAQAYLKAQGVSATERDELELLRARVAQLEAGDIPLKQSSEDEIAALEAASVASGFDEYTPTQLLDYIEERSGSRPHHKTSRDNLLNLAKGL